MAQGPVNHFCHFPAGMIGKRGKCFDAVELKCGAVAHAAAIQRKSQLVRVRHRTRNNRIRRCDVEQRLEIAADIVIRTVLKQCAFG